MEKPLAGNEWSWKLARTVVQGMLSAAVANIDAFVGAGLPRTRRPNAPESLESKQDIPRLQLENPKPVTFWNIALCAKRIYAAAE